MTDQMQPRPSTPPAGWYQDAHGSVRWFDGIQWTEHVQPPQQPVHQSFGPMTSSQINVKREASYVRQQTPHSLTKHVLLGWLLLYIPTIYYAVSPNHYFTL